MKTEKETIIEYLESVKFSSHKYYVELIEGYVEFKQKRLNELLEKERLRLLKEKKETKEVKNVRKEKIAKVLQD